MADWTRRITASVRIRATVGATAVVAAVLAAAAVALVLLQRDALRSGAMQAAQARAEQVADQVATGGPAAVRYEEDSDDDDDDEPGDVVVQVHDRNNVVVSSQPLPRLPTDEGNHRLPGADHRYAIASSETEWADTEYTVAVAVSLEDAEESVATLVPLLAVGVPVVVLFVAGVTWRVIGRSLAPVDRLRREVDAITDERLDLRLATPAGRDEIHRLATTMNSMLERLQSARDRQRRFVSDASHELRSPIATLRQTGEVATAHPDAIDRGEFADTVVVEALRLQRLVDQLLLLTRADEGRATATTREVDIDDLLFAAAARIRRDRPDLAVDSSGIGAVRVRGNPLALDQVVRNLTDNATRHARSLVRLAVTEAAGWVDITVADDGTGVPVGDRDRIFERFVRLDEARARDDGGSGLGLAIVRDIVVAHGGRVDVRPTDSGGALFVVALPAAS